MDNKLTTRTKKKIRPKKTASFIESARREQIIDVAIQAISAVGYGNASLAEIAKRAKVSKGVILYYFSNKEELVGKVIERIFGLAGERMRMRHEAPTAGAKLTKYIELNIDFLKENREQALVLVDILMNARDKKGKSILASADYEPAFADLERILVEGQERGEFRKFSARVMAASIRGSIDAIPGQMMKHPELDLESYAKELVELFERAVRSE